MKKFYKKAEAGTAPGGYVVRLDGKTIKTPLKNHQIVPSPQLAAEMAMEWDRQGDEIKPAIMPLTQLANTMIDKGQGADRAEITEQLLDFGASDLLCYFAATPPELAMRQKKLWQPLLDWVRQEYGIHLLTVEGIQYITQPDESQEKLQVLIEGLEASDFTVLQAAASAAGSVVIGLALMAGKISAGEAHAAACVDEAFQLEKWGEDTEARTRLENIKAELSVIARFHELVKATN
jgi:chaperone required for assembly of F1-ATPase